MSNLDLYFFLVLEFGKESIAGYVADDKYPKQQKTGHKKTTPYSSELLKFFSPLLNPHRRNIILVPYLAKKIQFKTMKHIKINALMAAVTLMAAQTSILPHGMQAANPVKVENLNLYYGENHALKDVNMDIQENAVTAFIGPSGCGKSTFLKTLNRMNDLIEGVKIDGEVYLDGANIFTEMDDITLRHRVGMVFQQPNPFPKSIYDNIAYGPRLFGVHKKAELDIIVEKALKQAAIWDEVKDRLKKSALGLSGGQQQRLCIARTLAVEPEVILMDEPTSALDPISTSRIEDLAIELKNDYTIIMVTHNMQQATRISDNTAFFLLGEMIEYDKTEQLFSMPKNKKTEDYITGRFG